MVEKFNYEKVMNKPFIENVFQCLIEVDSVEKHLEFLESINSITKFFSKPVSSLCSSNSLWNISNCEMFSFLMV